MKDADFLAFIRSERKRLIHYVRSLLRGAADMDAEDVVQDVLTKMLERPDASAELGNLTSYVYRSVRNRVIDLGRTRKATVSLDADPDGDHGLAEVLADTKPDALGLLQTEQGERALFAALDTLSEIERRVVIAHEFEGVAYRELSATLNIPLNTLLSHKSRALKKLKEHFSTVR
jgi:RNA polymerase sigma factor (sigma-70 family)